MQIEEVEDWIAEAKDRLKAWGAEELRQLRLTNMSETAKSMSSASDAVR